MAPIARRPVAKEADVWLALPARYTSPALDSCLLGQVPRTWLKVLPCASVASTMYLPMPIVFVSRIDCMRFLPRCAKTRALKGEATTSNSS